MIVAGWNNGSPNDMTGAGYGIRITHKDRDRYFHRAWTYMTIELDNKDLMGIQLSDSFWRGCTELRSAKIGKWMLEHKIAPRQKGTPPKLRLEPVGNRKFKNY